MSIRVNLIGAFGAAAEHIRTQHGSHQHACSRAGTHRDSDLRRLHRGWPGAVPCDNDVSEAPDWVPLATALVCVSASRVQPIIFIITTRAECADAD